MNKKIFFYFGFLIFLIGFVFSAGGDTNEEENTIKTFFESEFFSKIGILLGLGENDLSVKGIELTQGEDENTLTFSEGGEINLRGDLFKDIGEGSLIKLNNLGEIKSADLIATEDTSFNFKGFGDAIKVSKGNRLVYDGNKMTIYKNEGKESISLRQNVFDENGNNIGKFMDIKMIGDSFNIEKATNGNILTGNFELLGGENKIYGLGEGTVGKVAVSKEGRVTEIFSGTNADMRNVNHKVMGNSLKIFYDNDFNVSAHMGENYFNYARDKIYAGGYGFTSDLTKSTNVFGDMKTTKYVEGIGTKTRGLQLEMNGGNLEISKDASQKNDLAFNINGQGDYVIDNGRNVIHSQKGYVLKNGKYVLSDENSFFVKTNFGEEESYGLSTSYDLNFNKGEYVLKDNVFSNNKGEVLINTNLEWEEIIRKINEGDYENEELRRMIDDKTGVRSRNYISYLKDREALAKYICEARDSANENIYGTKITFDEVFTRYMLEGGAFYNPGYPVYEFDNNGPESDISGSRIGLDYIKGNQVALEKGGFLEEGFLNNFSNYNIFNEQGKPMETLTFSSVKDSITAFAGELARRKYVLEKDIKEVYGEQELKRMSDEEKYFWLTYYFNAGEGAGKGELTGTKYNTYVLDDKTGGSIPKTVQGRGREAVYKKWSGEESGTNPRFNSHLSEATYALMKRWGIFSSV